MNLTKFSLTLLIGLLLNACSNSKNKIFWVSGMKTECSGGAGKMQCLIVHKGKNLDEAIWENFYSPIEGFEFEEGFMKKLEIREERRKLRQYLDLFQRKVEDAKKVAEKKDTQ